MDDTEQLDERDHRVLGKKLGLFTFSDTVGKGLPLWTAKGATIRRELERFVIDEEIRWGYQHVYTPDIAKLDLYKKSGHYPYYKDTMYAPITIDEEEFMLRPMTCPHHFELYLSQPRSYRDLPMRIAEVAKLYRYELSGVLSGLTRVRSFCLADAHIVCTETQAKVEISKALDLIEHLSKIFGLKMGEDYSYRLSLGDRQNTKKYYDDPESWDASEQILREVLCDRECKFVEAPDEAAFYGPKIDIQMKSITGREETAFTVQYDFVMPERFKLSYIDEHNKSQKPIVIHRSSIGALERIIAFLIEHYNGDFPTWLSPIQVAILSVSEKHQNYAEEISLKLKHLNIRTKLDTSAETLGKKIREAETEKIPNIVVVGDKEIEKETLSIRSRHSKDLVTMVFEDFAKLINRKIAEKSLD